MAATWNCLKAVLADYPVGVYFGSSLFMRWSGERHHNAAGLYGISIIGKHQLADDSRRVRCCRVSENKRRPCAHLCIDGAVGLELQIRYGTVTPVVYFRG